MLNFFTLMYGSTKIINCLWIYVSMLPYALSYINWFTPVGDNWRNSNPHQIQFFFAQGSMVQLIYENFELFSNFKSLVSYDEFRFFILIKVLLMILFWLLSYIRFFIYDILKLLYRIWFDCIGSLKMGIYELRN